VSGDEAVAGAEVEKGIVGAMMVGEDCVENLLGVGWAEGCVC